MAYFLRFTNRAELDLERKTSVHATPFETLEDCMENDDSEEYVMLDDGIYGIVLDGLCGYELEADELEDAIDEVKDGSWDYDLDDSDFPWVIFEGEHASADVPDGDCFVPEKIVFKSVN